MRLRTSAHSTALGGVVASTCGNGVKNSSAFFMANTENDDNKCCYAPGSNHLAPTCHPETQGACFLRSQCFIAAGFSGLGFMATFRGYGHGKYTQKARNNNHDGHDRVTTSR